MTDHLYAAFPCVWAIVEEYLALGRLWSYWTQDRSPSLTTDEKRSQGRQAAFDGRTSARPCPT